MCGSSASLGHACMAFQFKLAPDSDSDSDSDVPLSNLDVTLEALFFSGPAYGRSLMVMVQRCSLSSEQDKTRQK